MEKSRQAIIDVCRTLYHKGMACSTGGNVSIRSGDAICITKTDTALGRLTPGHLVVCNLAGHPLEAGKPSKEISFHAAIYAVRSDIAAVVHLHSPFAMVLAQYDLPNDDFLPRCSPGAVSRVGKVPVIEYYKPGSSILAKRIADTALEADRAIFLARHGIITYAASLSEAADIAEEFEHNARLYVLSEGKIPLLSEAEAEELR
jgi:ribulose-5-phosphate 4-epimerase/fuculose-1-phosphate aldolase